MLYAPDFVANAGGVINVYGEHRAQASVLLRGTSGFGRLHHLHTDRLLTLSEDLPVVSIAVDDGAVRALLQGKSLLPAGVTRTFALIQISGKTPGTVVVTL